MEELKKPQIEIGKTTPETVLPLEIPPIEMSAIRTSEEIEADKANELAAASGIKVQLENLTPATENFPAPVLGQSNQFNESDPVKLITTEGGLLNASAVEKHVALEQLAA